MTIDSTIITVHGEEITLEEAVRRFEVSPIIQRFGTWVVTTYGVESLVTSYFFELDRVGELEWDAHMYNKKWVNMADFTLALTFARHLLTTKEELLEFGRSLKVFLCHAKEDNLEVKKLYNWLKAIGVEPWLDEESLIAGQDWKIEIPKAVRKSDIVLVCLSQSSVDKTGYVQREIKIALDAAEERPDGKIYLIPVKLEDCNVPERVGEKHWVDLYKEGGHTRLVRAFKEFIKQSKPYEQ